MILNIIRIIVGIVFALFLPGYLLTFILFRKLKLLERICLAIGLSIFVVVFLSFYLTAISFFSSEAGITTMGVWLSLLITCALFIIIIISKNKTSHPKGTLTIKKLFGIIIFFSGIYHLYSLINKIIGKPKVTILMYHRIALAHDKQKNLLDSNVVSVSLEDFEKQMKHLSKNGNVITFDEFLDCYKKKGLTKDSVIITFDDGYKDNYLYAYPVLRKYKLSATISLTTGHINSNKLFWWDKIAYIIHKTKIKRFTLDGLGTFSLKNKPKIIQIIQEKVKKIPENKKNYLIARLAKKLNVKIPLARNLFLSWNDVRKMSNNHISFSAHTVTHPILTRVSLKQAKDEIMLSKKKIERETKKQVSVFTYPNGDRKDMSITINQFLEKNGFSFALSTIYGANDLNIDPFRLKRVSVEDDDDLRLFQIKVSGLGKFFEPVYSLLKK